VFLHVPAKVKVMSKVLAFLAIAAGFAIMPTISVAQVYKPQVTRPQAPRIQTPSAGLIQRNTSANLTRRPSVSPYLNLINNNDPNLTNYQSLVRPQINQQRVNSQQSAQINRLEAKPPTSGNAGSESLRSTGHQATWKNYSHYYPKLQ
jgi:hypothetical protein